MTLSKPEDFDAKTASADELRSLRLSQSIHPQSGSVEFSAPLENSVSLEAPRQMYVPVSTQVLPLQTDLMDERLSATPPLSAAPPLSTTPPLVVAEETIQLLEERLVVNRTKRKVGEVTVRKEIETRIIEVPVRREKLIVEQVSPEYKQLAVVDLGEAQQDEFDSEVAGDRFPSVDGRFTSVNAAIQFLEAIAAQSDSGLQSVQISIVLKDATLQATYQHLLERYSARILP